MRRVVVVGLVGGAVVATAVVVARRRVGPEVEGGRPEWAPLQLAGPGAANRSGYGSTDASHRASVPRSAAEDGAKWVPADVDGQCPDSHPVKGKKSSGIFHVPGGAFYAQTKAERCYCDEEAAEADGYRKSKR